MSKRILVVDDDQYIREIYEELLQDEGFEVEIVNNGQEGLMKLKQGGYQLCLLDLMMPKLDGLGVLDGLYENPPENKNGPIIILSNLSHEEVIKDAKKKGAASYLIKADLTPDMLIDEIKKYLKD